MFAKFEMTILIEAQGVKREIVGPYQLMLKRTDALNLLNTLKATLYDDDFLMGWIKVSELTQPDTVANLTPQPWK